VAEPSTAAARYGGRHLKRSVDSDAFRALLTRLEASVGRDEVEGAAAGIAVGSDQAIGAFGTARLASGSVPVSPEHRFLLASLAKPLTSLQVLELAGRGLVDLGAPVADYVPEFAVNGKGSVSVRQLLTHTSGLDPSANTTEGPSRLDARDHLRIALNAHLVFAPGTRAEYCSPAFWVLAELVARVSGSPYTEHLVDRVLGPLGMSDTCYELGDAAQVERYVPTPEAHASMAEHARRIAYPAGGVVGSVSDVLKLGAWLLGGGDDGTVLSPAARRSLWEGHAEGWFEGRPARWTLGSWRLGGPGDFRSDRTLCASGASGTCAWIDPEAGIAAVFLSASWLRSSHRVFGQFMNGVFKCQVAGA
jgi:serine-type D-Ala-D-Ala carboxypeptidase